MWIAQHPCGTWCSCKEKPREKLGGWDGERHAMLVRDGFDSELEVYVERTVRRRISEKIST